MLTGGLIFRRSASVLLCLNNKTLRKIIHKACLFEQAFVLSIYGKHKMIWKKNTTIEQLNQLCQHSAISHLGIEFTAQQNDSLEATVPVDHRTTQPFGLLHGGISATLAETLGSAAALLYCEENQIPVGTELNISHLKAIKSGKATGRATPLHLGKESQVWQIEIRDDAQQLCAVARLSTKLLSQR